MQLTHSPINGLSLYSQPPHQWGETFSDLKKCDTHLELPLFWGAHEKMQGHRDFSKSLPLEKLLRLASEKGVSVHAMIGFTPGNETFPEWCQGVKTFERIPQSLWSGSDEEYVLSRIPAIDSSAFLTSWLEYINETFGLLSLYRVPEGTVDRLTFDFGVYECALDLQRSPFFVEGMKRRYSDVQVLNRRYGTSFPHIDSVGLEKSWFSMIDRRPWLASYDYKWVRKLFFQSLWEQVTRLDSYKEIESMIQFAPDPVGIDGAREWQVLTDSTLLEAHRDWVGPFLSGGQPNSNAVLSFRVFEMLKEGALELGVGLGLLPQFQAPGLSEKRLLTIVSGKYLSQVAVSWLLKYVEKGGQLFFPWGVPGLNENLQAIDLLGGREGIRKQHNGISLSHHKRGSGAIWVGGLSSTLGDELWGVLDELSEEIVSHEE